MNIEYKKLIKDTVENLMIDLWRAKGFNDVHNRNAAKYNAFEADMKDRWEAIEYALAELLDGYERTDYESQIEDLEDTIKEQKEEYDALMIKYEDLEEDYKDLEKTLDKVKEAIWS